MSWHFLQGQEEESWEGTCLDGAPDALLSLLHTNEAYYSPGSATDCYRTSPSGMTCELSMESLGADVLMSLAVDSPAQIFQQREKVQGSKESTNDE